MLRIVIWTRFFTKPVCWQNSVVIFEKSYLPHMTSFWSILKVNRNSEIFKTFKKVRIICQDWQHIRNLTSHQSMITFLMNLYFLSLHCLGFLILLILLFQDNCQLIGVPKTKESSWTKWRTFIGITLIYSNIVLIKYFKDPFLTMR